MLNVSRSTLLLFWDLLIFEDPSTIAEMGVLYLRDLEKVTK